MEPFRGCVIKVSKFQKKNCFPRFSKKMNAGAFYVLKNAPAFVILENLGQQIFFRDLLTFTTCFLIQKLSKLIRLSHDG